MHKNDILKELGPRDYQIEETHSDILAYLLNPAHEFGTAFLRIFVEHAVDVEDGFFEYDGAQIQREYGVAGGAGRVDLLIELPCKDGSQFYCIVENKFFSSEQGDQLALYYEEYADQQAVFIFLTPRKQLASHPEYISYSYAQIADQLRIVLEKRSQAIPLYASVLVRQYVNLLDQFIIGEFRSIDTVRRELTAYLKRLIQESDVVEIDSIQTYADTWVGFIPLIWSKNETLMQLRDSWGLAFHISKNDGLSIEFYWDAQDVNPDVIYRCLHSHVATDDVHAPQRIGTGIRVWKSVYSQVLFDAHELNSVLNEDHISSQVREKIRTGLNQFYLMIDAIHNALRECTALAGGLT